MPGVEFADTNVVVYALGATDPRKDRAIDLLAGAPVISTQVLNEFVAVLRRKRLLADDKITTAVDDVVRWCRVVTVEMIHIKSALDLMIKYQLSYYDALIVATALEAACVTLYSEDMQHGQIFEGRLQVINPFLESA